MDDASLHHAGWERYEDKGAPYWYHPETDATNLNRPTLEEVVEHAKRKEEREDPVNRREALSEALLMATDAADDSDEPQPEPDPEPDPDPEPEPEPDDSRAHRRSGRRVRNKVERWLPDAFTSTQQRKKRGQTQPSKSQATSKKRSTPSLAMKEKSKQLSIIFGLIKGGDKLDEVYRLFKGRATKTGGAGAGGMGGTRAIMVQICKAFTGWVRHRAPRSLQYGGATAALPPPPLPGPELVDQVMESWRSGDKASLFRGIDKNVVRKLAELMGDAGAVQAIIIYGCGTGQAPRGRGRGPRDNYMTYISENILWQRQSIPSDNENTKKWPVCWGTAKPVVFDQGLKEERGGRSLPWGRGGGANGCFTPRPSRRWARR